MLRLNREELDKAVANLFVAPAPGTRNKPICPNPDVALNWKDRVKAYKTRKAKRDAEDAIDDYLEEDSDEAQPSP